MNKEEQIKRLAQNLFNSGFTKSMDHAIQTAANMLGFPDSMLTSKSTQESREKQGEHTVTTGVSGMYNRDLAKRITQSIAEERVFSQVPNSVRSAFETANSRVSQSQSNSDVQVQQSNQADIQMKTQSEAQNFSDDDLFVRGSYDEKVIEHTNHELHNVDEDIFSNQSSENSVGDEMAHETSDHDLYSSQPHILDNESYTESSYSNENFIEEKNDVSESEMPEWNEEEQTSLISGFVDSNSSSEGSFESLSGAETHENYNNIFKGGNSKNLDMVDNSKNYQIESRFEAVLGGEEDFFTISSHSNTVENNPVRMNDEHLKDSFESSVPTQSVTQATPVQQQRQTVESTVDLAQMFDFRNLKN